MPSKDQSTKLSSMTAWGFGEAKEGDFVSSCEIRSLNTRFLEVNVRLPRSLLALEIDLINFTKTQFKRGKIDLFVDLKEESAKLQLPTLKPLAVEHYVHMFKELEHSLDKQGLKLQKENLSPFEFLALEGLLTSSPKQMSDKGFAEAYRPLIFKAVEEACSQVKLARAKEGQALASALRELLSTLRQTLDQVLEKREIIAETLKSTYLKRLSQVKGQLSKSALEEGQAELTLDESRLMLEIAILLDKADIEEEITRLKTHIQEFERLVDEEEAAGRKLDFLCQELHREVNTISSKLIQSEVQYLTIEMKQTVERIRQQVQNLE